MFPRSAARPDHRSSGGALPDEVRQKERRRLPPEIVCAKDKLFGEWCATSAPPLGRWRLGPAAARSWPGRLDREPLANAAPGAPVRPAALGLMELGVLFLRLFSWRKSDGSHNNVKIFMT